MCLPDISELIFDNVQVEDFIKQTTLALITQRSGRMEIGISVWVVIADQE